MLVVAVTPFAGVWIEMFSLSVSIPGASVTPFAGVWIEICRISRSGSLF